MDLLKTRTPLIVIAAGILALGLASLSSTQASVFNSPLPSPSPTTCLLDALGAAGQPTPIGVFWDGYHPQ